MLKIITNLTKSIIDSIQNTGVAVVKSLHIKIDEAVKSVLSHTFPVKVINPQESVKVSGEVKVTNQIKLDELSKKLDSLKQAVISYKAPDKIEVKNFPKWDFPKEIKVSNLNNKAEVSNLGVVVNALGEVKKAVNNLKLNPEIKVEPKIEPPIVNLPKQDPPIVNLQEKEVDLSALKDLLEFWQSLTVNAKKSLSVRLSDGKEFYKAVDRIAESTTNFSFPFTNLGGDAVRAIVNRFNELMVTTSDTWDTNHVDRSTPNITYYGEESVDGKWRIRKVVINNNIETYTYATNTNNPSIASYPNAWQDRQTLVYSRIGQV